MANIMINRNCNLNCPYCFANEFVNKFCTKDDIYMTVENFKKALSFIVNSGEDFVGIIGGEPTLHPQLAEILEIALNEPGINSVTLFTNALELKKFSKYLTHPKMGVLVNLNSPNDIGQNNYNKIIENLDFCYEIVYPKSRISIGINMYKVDFDFEYMIEALKRYGNKKVRTAIAVPNDAEKKNTNVIEYFKSMKPRVFEFFRELDKIGVMPGYDCNLMPMCITTPEEKLWLEGFWRYEKGLVDCRCNITDNPSCNPVIDILPDLSTVRCFGCSEECKTSIDKFRNTEDLTGYFQNELDDFAYSIPTTEQCIDCYYRKTKQCSGGCFSFKSSKIKKAKEMLKTFKGE